MPDASKHTTANEPVAAIDPGGARPTSAGHRDPATPPVPDKQKVVSGNQNQPADERAR